MRVLENRNRLLKNGSTKISALENGSIRLLKSRQWKMAVLTNASLQNLQMQYLRGFFFGMSDSLG